MRFGSLFSGIGGLDLGLERAGMECAWQVEIDDWCRKVLTKHWPDVPKYGDIKELSGEELEPVNLIAGGFPCQSVSTAGRRLRRADERWLWPDFWRIARVLRPRYILVENVAGLFDGGIEQVLGDLAEGGYDAEWSTVSACSLGASHVRWRVFIVAYTASIRPSEPRITGGYGAPHSDWQASDAINAVRRGSLPIVCREDHGISNRMDRLKGLGNAVVPQVAQWLGERMMMAERV